MNELTKEQIKSLIISSILVCLGILFVVLKSEMLGVIETIVCFALLGFGIIEIMIYCFLNTENRDYSKLIIGAVATVLALLLIFVGVLFVIILGVVVAVSGALYIKRAIQDKRAGVKNWWSSLVIGIMIIALGLTIAILYNLESFRNFIMILFGVTLIFEGVSGLIFTFVLHKEIKLFTKTIKVNSNKAENIEPEYTIIDNSEEKTQKPSKNTEKSLKNIEITKKINNISADENNNETQDIDDSDDNGFV